MGLNFYIKYLTTYSGQLLEVCVKKRCAVKPAEPCSPTSGKDVLGFIMLS